MSGSIAFHRSFFFTIKNLCCADTWAIVNTNIVVRAGDGDRRSGSDREEVRVRHASAALSWLYLDEAPPFSVLSPVFPQHCLLWFK